MHIINVSEPYFSQIARGEKTVEGRLLRGKFFDFRVWDEVLVCCGEKNVVRIISELKIYNGLDEFLVDNLNFAMPGKTFDEAKIEYEKIYADHSNYKFLAIKF